MKDPCFNVVNEAYLCLIIRTFHSENNKCRDYDNETMLYCGMNDQNHVISCDHRVYNDQ